MRHLLDTSAVESAAEICSMGSPKAVAAAAAANAFAI